MPYTITWEDRGAYKRFYGQIKFDEYARSQEIVLSDPRCDEIRFVINDMLDVTGYSITRDEAEYAAVFNRGSSLSNPKLRVAYVTTDNRIRLLIKTVGMLSSLELGVFATLPEARQWAEAAH